MKAPSGRPSVFAEINMIPLIDITLIIMIILMVLTPMLVHQQLSVKLPKATASDKADVAKTIQVEIRKDGSYRIGGKRYKKDQLEKELVLRLRKAAENRILVQADESVPVQAVVFVLDLAKKLGVGDMGIGVLNKT